MEEQEARRGKRKRESVEKEKRDEITENVLKDRGMESVLKRIGKGWGCWTRRAREE